MPSWVLVYLRPCVWVWPDKWEFKWNIQHQPWPGHVWWCGGEMHKRLRNFKSILFFSLQIPVELPPIPKVDNDTLVMIIEQLLMLTLIIGRWMLPKVRSNKSYLQSCIYACSSLQGSMSRDELAQLLLTYIGTAADIIEFFDSFKARRMYNYF